MLVKIIGSILVIFSTSFLGYLLSWEKIRRLEQLKELKKSIYLLKGDIQYGFTPLPEAFANMGKKCSPAFSTFFARVASDLKEFQGQSFYGIWKKRIGEELKETALSKGDKEKLMGLGETLGYLDQEMQLSTIKLYLENLEEEISTETKSQKEKIKLCQVLGVLSGIFITIVMI